MNDALANEARRIEEWLRPRHPDHLALKEALISLPNDRLRAVVKSTSPSGRFWLELVWARDELARRED
jgi:signal transduction histidine kinase